MTRLNFSSLPNTGYFLLRFLHSRFLLVKAVSCIVDSAYTPHVMQARWFHCSDSMNLIKPLSYTPRLG